MKHYKVWFVIEVPDEATQEDVYETAAYMLGFESGKPAKDNPVNYDKAVANAELFVEHVKF